MLPSAVVQFFKYKVVSSVLVLACWPAAERTKFVRLLSSYGTKVTVSCDPSALDYVQNQFQGVLFFVGQTDDLLDKVKWEHYSLWYKWLLVGNSLPRQVNTTVRYDVDMVLLTPNRAAEETADNELHYEESDDALSLAVSQLGFLDVYVHPSEGVSVHPWAYWSEEQLVVTHERERILRRLDLKRFPMKISTPIGHYTNDTFDSLVSYLRDLSTPEKDSATRCGYGAASLLLEAINATEVVIETLYWSAEVHPSNMLGLVSSGQADLAGSTLRALPARIQRLDYVTPIWPFSVGFTYLGERESSSNMYVEPFSASVWASCLGLGAVLAAALRLTARRTIEKDEAYMAVMATWLQQDAAAAPEGISGRWTFIVLSISSMLVHAYYTSAIVSALMSSGRGGPTSLRALADSKYDIASEDYDYMRFQFFDVKTNRSDLEYLKRKKKITSSFYQDVENGIKLIQAGTTAYHAEYNQIYPYMNTFSDDQLCKLASVDTIPEIMSWVTTSKRCQWTDVLRTAGAWIHETGLAKRLLSKIQQQPPPCRSAMLAERVNFRDVAPLLLVTALGAMLSFILLAAEILMFRCQNKGEDKVNTEVEDISEDSSSELNVAAYHDSSN